MDKTIFEEDVINPSNGQGISLTKESLVMGELEDAQI